MNSALPRSPAELRAAGAAAALPQAGCGRAALGSAQRIRARPGAPLPPAAWAIAPPAGRAAPRQGAAAEGGNVGSALAVSPRVWEPTSTL